MQSTAHIAGHPIHPMLIPYPFALLTSGTAFDVAAWLQRRDDWAATARQLTGVGLAAAVVAAIPGMIDYFGSVPPRSRSRRDATLHALCNVSALGCFLAANRQRRGDAPLSRGAMALSLLGTGLLSAGGWLGGELVYHEHVAVVEAGDTARRALP